MCMLNSHLTDSPELFTANKSDILNIIILQRRDELINSIEFYKEREMLGYDTSKIVAKIRSKILSLYMEISRALERKYDKKETFIEFKEKMSKINELEPKEFIELFLYMNTALDELGLIKIDVRKSYDTASIETENEEKGL